MDPESIRQQLEWLRARREVTEELGVPALQRLVGVAQKGSGQSRTVRQFLLGLYNGPQWPMDLTALRGLDPDLQQDVVRVLLMDMAGPRLEVHEHIAQGEQVFRALWEREVRARGE
ncbi:hypothetical protein J2T57_001443 [Natronocella acetinitrilica]|uniref:DUF7673 domain-containing protein n=1 Tax=Natronocella acetinitrilica TaxID=414046 RepID=A0AAE3G237_9GAMM|nr:hypothetical protein [Natronocella acetinitrilica]MCP1674341.1 hypothetical protein [Natronocella acetinitrilica]